VCINTSPAPERCFFINYFPCFSGAGEVYLNTSPTPEKYFYIYTYLISQAPEKPGTYLKTPLRCQISIYTHFFGAGEVLIYTYLVPEKYLYTFFRRQRSAYIHLFGTGEAGEVFIYFYWVKFIPHIICCRPPSRRLSRPPAAICAKPATKNAA